MPVTRRTDTIDVVPDAGSSISLDLGAMRRDYERGRLGESDAVGDWTGLFGRWFAEAQADPAVIEPNAIQLATVDGHGRPSVRTVLAKSIGARGLVFYTSYTSDKGRDLAATPWSAAVFAWLAHQRQVRFSGPTAPVAPAETERYFAQRPRGSQIGAWASPQSAVVADRQELDDAVARIERQFADTATIPPPPGWGGYLLRPTTVEFWQGRPGRMHDRIRFQRQVAAGSVAAVTATAAADPGDEIPTGPWQIDRLAP